MTKIFTQTSDAPYDSCYYELYYENGKKEVWEDYEELRDHWLLNSGWGMSHIEIKDRKPLKSKGFK